MVTIFYFFRIGIHILHLLPFHGLRLCVLNNILGTVVACIYLFYNNLFSQTDCVENMCTVHIHIAHTVYRFNINNICIQLHMNVVRPIPL